ncbi:MAG TPA: hypothetical protein VNQ97_09535 [Burkholderiaceae bacterium]|nr:hypothetical protein [Burkholderiaceae bacterium]
MLLGCRLAGRGSTIGLLFSRCVCRFLERAGGVDAGPAQTLAIRLSSVDHPTLALKTAIEGDTSERAVECQNHDLIADVVANSNDVTVDVIQEEPLAWAGMAIFAHAAQAAGGGDARSRCSRVALTDSQWLSVARVRDRPASGRLRG